MQNYMYKIDGLIWSHRTQKKNQKQKKLVLHYFICMILLSVTVSIII